MVCRMRRIGVWLSAGAIVLAGCGGGDDSSDPVEPDADQAAQVTVPEASDDAQGDVAASDDTNDGGSDPAPAADGPVAEDRGPLLVPRTTIALPDAGGTGGGVVGVALSPSGDQVAAVWRTVDADGAEQRTLGVYDASTGAELVAGSDERLGNELFWSVAGQLVSGANFGELWEWDPTTATAVSDAPVSMEAFESLSCAGGNGAGFDPAAGAVFLLFEGVCRIDIATGAIVEHNTGELFGDLRVGLGGNEVYVKWVTDDNVLMRRVLDATTLEVIADEVADPYVRALSGNGRVEDAGGFDRVIQPSGRTIDYLGLVVETSAGGGYYASERDGLLSIVSSVDGSSVGSVDGTSDRIVDTAWSADDGVLVVRTETALTIYDIG